MAGLNLNVMTLLDYAKLKNLNGATVSVIEILNTVGADELLKTAYFKPTNYELSEVTTIRTGLPTVAAVQFGEAWGSSKSDYAKESFNTAMFKTRTEIDKDTYTKMPDVDILKSKEFSASMEALYQKFATTTFYGNYDTENREFTGLAKYYSSTTSKSSKNLLLAGGTGSSTRLTSIYLAVYGDNKVYFVFPKASSAGIKYEDMGFLPKYDAVDPTKYKYDWVREWEMNAGLCVADWRYAGRIANIDVDANMTIGDSTDNSVNILKKMSFLKNRIPNINSGRAVWYMNSDMYSILENMMLEKIAGSTLAYKQLADGLNVLTAHGIEIAKCDSIVNSESLVS